MFEVLNGYLWVVTNHQPQTKNFLISNLSKIINAFLTKYDNILVMGDFNLTVENKHLEELLNLFNLFNFIAFLKLGSHRAKNPDSIAKWAITLFWCEC